MNPLGLGVGRVSGSFILLGPGQSFLKELGAGEGWCWVLHPPEAQVRLPEELRVGGWCWVLHTSEAQGRLPERARRS